MHICATCAKVQKSGTLPCQPASDHMPESAKLAKLAKLPNWQFGRFAKTPIPGPPHPRYPYQRLFKIPKVGVHLETEATWLQLL